MSLLIKGGLSQADADARYVNVAGDTMTGDLDLATHLVKFGAEGGIRAQAGQGLWVRNAADDDFVNLVVAWLTAQTGLTSVGDASFGGRLRPQSTGANLRLCAYIGAALTDYLRCVKVASGDGIVQIMTGVDLEIVDRSLMLTGGGMDDIPFYDLSEIIIAAGVITRTKAFHRIDTEANDATDDLDTINGGRNGLTLLIQPIDDARDIVVKHGTGNIYLLGDADFTMTHSRDKLWLLYLIDGWYELFRLDSGA